MIMGVRIGKFLEIAVNHQQSAKYILTLKVYKINSLFFLNNFNNNEKIRVTSNGWQHMLFKILHKT